MAGLGLPVFQRIQGSGGRFEHDGSSTNEYSKLSSVVRISLDRVRDDSDAGDEWPVKLSSCETIAAGVTVST